MNFEVKVRRTWTFRAQRLSTYKYWCCSAVAESEAIQVRDCMCVVNLK